MAGAMQTDYICETKVWDEVYRRLCDSGLCIEQKGSLETDNLFLDVKAHADSSHGAWLSPKLERRAATQSSVIVEMHWVWKNAGLEPRASFDIAVRVEGFLLASGAVCNDKPVSSGLHESF